MDEKLISVHQWIVDETERKPAWWVEHTAWAYIAISIVSVALRWRSGWDVVIIAAVLAMGSRCILYAQNPAKLYADALRSMPLRVFLVFLTAYSVADLAIQRDTVSTTNLLSNLLLTSSYYFAACHPPRPRKRRQVARLSSAT